MRSPRGAGVTLPGRGVGSKVCWPALLPSVRCAAVKIRSGQQGPVVKSPTINRLPCVGNTRALGRLRSEIGFRMLLATTVGPISATNGAQLQVSTRNLSEEDPADSAGSGLGPYGSPVPPAVGADPGDAGLVGAGLVGAGLVGAGLVGAGPVDASYFRPAPPGGPTLVSQQTQGRGQAHPGDQARSWEQAHLRNPAHRRQRARSWGQARSREPTKNPS